MTERTRSLSEGGPIRVLQVDDDAAFLKTAKEILEMQGTFQVHTASSVEEAIGKMKTEKYDVVVCDYQMPQKDGLQFLRELRKKGNTIPFIMFTGKGREEVAMQALNLGANGYFSKSGHPETAYGELTHGIRQSVNKRRAEQSFLKSEDKYRRLVETLHEGIWAIDKESCTTFVNPRMAEILGYDIEEMKGRHLFSFMDERDVEIAKRLLERRKQGIKEQHDFEFLRKDGTRVYVTLETSPITDDNGNYIGALASVMDITERKRVEDALRQSKENFESLAENAFDGLLVATRGEVHVYANKRAAEITGYTVAELLRTTIKELVHPDESEKILERYQRRIEGKAVPNPCETAIIAKDGRTVPIELAGTRTIWEHNPADLVFFRDINERKKTEEALRASEEKHRVISGITADFVFSCVKADEEDFAIDWMMGATDRIFGYSAKEIQDEGCWKFTVQPQDLPTFEEKVTGLKPGQSSICELRITHKDDSTRWIKVSSQLVEDSTNPVNHRLFGACEDITERKKAEEKLSILNEKMGVVGKLTRHDVRNKLSAVVGNTYLAKKMLPNDHKALDYLRNIELACSEATRVLDFAGAYESLGVEELTLVDVDKAVEEAVSLVSELKGVKVVNNCQGLTVMADSVLRQLFFNLIENSLKHGKNVDQIQIYYEEGKDRLKLFYEDNGVGIPRADKPRLFDVGFTTGNGSGLGLPLIKRMMEIYGWTIEEEGEAGKGAKFVITIPMRADSNQKQRKSNKKTFY